MAGFTTTDDGGWEFSFDDTPEIPDLPIHDPFVQQGPEKANYLAGPGKWENYSDDVLYEIEALLRKFMESKKADPEWRRDRRGRLRRYTCGMMFEQLYGRPADQKSEEDRTKLRRMPKVMAYYSSKIQKSGSIRGKFTTCTIYTLSPKRFNMKPPYNLKLRIEWLSKQGKLPCWQNMRLPKDDLQAGQARNPKTNENMRRRRERGRELYNERYKDRAH